MKWLWRTEKVANTKIRNNIQSKKNVRFYYCPILSPLKQFGSVQGFSTEQSHRTPLFVQIWSLTILFCWYCQAVLRSDLWGTSQLQNMRFASEHTESILRLCVSGCTAFGKDILFEFHFLPLSNAACLPHECAGR